jgi:hypothetical protein
MKPTIHIHINVPVVKTRDAGFSGPLIPRAVKSQFNNGFRAALNYEGREVWISQYSWKTEAGAKEAAKEAIPAVRVGRSPSVRPSSAENASAKDALSLAEAERELKAELKLIEVFKKSGKPVPKEMIQRQKMLEEEVEKQKFKTGDAFAEYNPREVARLKDQLKKADNALSSGKINPGQHSKLVESIEKELKGFRGDKTKDTIYRSRFLNEIGRISQKLRLGLTGAELTKKTDGELESLMKELQKREKSYSNDASVPTTFFEGSAGQFKSEVKNLHPDATFTESQFRGGYMEITAKSKGETVGSVQELPTGKFRGGFRKDLQKTKDALSSAENAPAKDAEYPQWLKHAKNSLSPTDFAKVLHVMQTQGENAAMVMTKKMLTGDAYSNYPSFKEEARRKKSGD